MVCFSIRFSQFINVSCFSSLTPKSDFWVLLNSSLPKAVYCVCFVFNIFQICCWTYLRGISFSSHLLVSRSALTAWMISGARVVTVKRLLRFHHLAFVAVCLWVLSLSPGYNYLFNLYEPLSVCLGKWAKPQTDLNICISSNSLTLYRTENTKVWHVLNPLLFVSLLPSLQQTCCSAAVC